jgi:hypothetical protein
MRLEGRMRERKWLYKYETGEARNQMASSLPPDR